MRMKLPEAVRRPLAYTGLFATAAVAGGLAMHLLSPESPTTEGPLGSGAVGVGSNFQYSPDGTRTYDRHWYDQASGNSLSQEHVVEACNGTTLVSTVYPVNSTTPPQTSYMENSILCADHQLTPDDFDGGLPPGYTPPTSSTVSTEPAG
jgi:hypothetical protein